MVNKEDRHVVCRGFSHIYNVFFSSFFLSFLANLADLYDLVDPGDWDWDWDWDWDVEDGELRRAMECPTYLPTYLPT